MELNLEPIHEGEEGRSFAEIFSELASNLAAVVRQYRRAADAKDRVALAIETDSVACWIRRLITVHLEHRVGTSSPDWFWPDADKECKIELTEKGMRVSGRIWCSYQDGRREWTEPFAAKIVHSDDNLELADYTFWFGTPATLLNLTTTKSLVLRGERISPPAPANESDWAFVFLLGEASEEIEA